MIDHLDGKRLVVCIDNGGNEASLEQWKIYQSLPDEEADRHNEIRVIEIVIEYCYNRKGKRPKTITLF